MVIVEVNKKKFYLDGRLRLELEKIKKKLIRKDMDYVIVIDGEEGCGKSVFAMQVGKYLDNNLELSQVCMSPTEFIKAVVRADKGQCIIYDEAYAGLSSRGALTEINNLLVALMMEMRQKNLFVIVVLPTFFLLDKYVALWRARGLFHLYFKYGRRGQWIFFNKAKKRILYLLGKKLYSYKEPRVHFRGSFRDQYTISEEEYREKKRNALISKKRETRIEKYMNQRNTLVWILYKKFKKNPTLISKICKEYNFSLPRTTINDILLIKEKEIAQKELIEEEKEKILRHKVKKEGKSEPEPKKIKQEEDLYKKFIKIGTDEPISPTKS